MPLSERARVEVYLPDQARAPYPELLIALERERRREPAPSLSEQHGSEIEIRVKLNDCFLESGAKDWIITYAYADSIIQNGQDPPIGRSSL